MDKSISDSWAETIAASLRLSSVPEQLHDGIVNYLAHGIPPGSFLHAVLTNDLREACNRADPDCARELHGLVSWLYNYAPIVSWGDEATVVEWMEARRRERQAVAS